MAHAVQIQKQTPEGSCQRPQDWNLSSVPLEQAVCSQSAFSAHQVSGTSWRSSAVAQPVQILKQTPEGSRLGLLDSPEHTDSSQPAFPVPLWPLAGPGDVVLHPRLFWILKRRSEGFSQRSQYWNLSSVPLEQAMHSQFVSGWVHTRPLALPEDPVLWPRLFRSQSRHLKAPARACCTHQSTLTLD